MPGSDIRKDFPIFEDPNLIYLDSAASAHKPRAVVEALNRFYSTGYANIHRGVYRLSERATIAYDETREKVARFIGASSPSEIVFTHGATEAINLVAASWGRSFLKSGDEIIVTLFEHHANFVPWQMCARATGATIRYVAPGPDEGFSMKEFRKALSPRTKLVAVTQLANAIGVMPPLTEIIAESHRIGARVLVDGAQGISHDALDVKELNADFYVFSGHKLYGPTGIGVLYGKLDVLREMPPFLTGGDMIRRVSVDGTDFAEPPARFEAGTPHIAGVIGLGAAIDYLNGIGLSNIRRHEEELITVCEAGLRGLSGIRVLGPENAHQGLLVFACDGVHPHDLAQALAADGVCVRAGHHCNQPLLAHFGLQATTRVSVGMYNTEEDVDGFLKGVEKAIRFFRR